MWFMYGVNARMIGFYATPLMARSLFDRYEETGDEYLLRMGYGGALVIWTCVEPSGRGYNTREWRFNPPAPGHPEYHYYRNGCTSGELGNGLHGLMDFIKAYLVRDPDFGAVGYGCEVSETDDTYTIEPWDGVGARVVCMPLGVRVESIQGKIKSVTVSKKKDRIEVVLEKPYDKADRLAVTVSGLESGRYVLDGDEVLVTDCETIEHCVEYGADDFLNVDIRRTK